MTQKELDILTNIIGAVETGGQIYGKRRYECYVPPYHNSSAEHTCTLGWAGNYGARARKLCQMIFDENPSEFRKADSANIEKKLKVDWVATKWNPSSSEKTALIAIITTDTGKKCQDKLFQESVKSYIKNAEDFGVMDVKAQMMWCEIEHLGGLKPVKRIFARATKPYTPESIFASLLKDQNDTSSNNQVGDKKFQSRHECCVRWINQYVKSSTSTSTSTSTMNKGSDNKMTVNDLINKLIAVFKSEDGYLEKASNSNLDSKKANAGSRNYTKYWRDIANWGLGNYQAQYWCAAFIHWCFVKTFGLDNAKKLLLHAPYISCQTGYEKFKAKGRVYSSPKVGDVVVFWNGSRYSHTEFVIGVNGKTFITCGGNTAVSGAVANGGGVFYGKTYTLNTSKHKFLRPDYASILGSNITVPTTSSSTTSSTLEKGATGSDVKTMQKMLIACGYTCGSFGADGDFGSGTLAALKAFQKDFNLDVDGLYGSISKKTLEKEYNSIDKAVRDAITWAIGIVENPKHGYDQTNRWSPDYDCSSFVIMAYENAGVKVKSVGGATYTKNMKSGFTKCGFKDVASKVNLQTGKGLIIGDVLLKAGYHTAIYLGNGKIAHASLNENGQITGGKTGDQASEIRIQSYFFDNWDTVLRYEKIESPSVTVETTNKKLNESVKWNGVVTASALNVRTWAGTNNKTVSFSPLKKNAIVGVCDSIKALDGSTWYYIKYNGKHGFVSSKYIKKKETVIKYKTISNLNLRSVAGVISKDNVLCVIPKGKTVTYNNKYKTVNGTKWYYVTYNKKTGYVSGKYLTKA